MGPVYRPLTLEDTFRRNYTRKWLQTRAAFEKVRKAVSAGRRATPFRRYAAPANVNKMMKEIANLTALSNAIRQGREQERRRKNRRRSAPLTGRKSW